MGFEGGEWLSRILVPIACRLSKPRNSFGKFASEEGESSYRQFLERRARGEGSSRRFFGREFAESAACEGRLAKGSKLRKNTKKPSKKVPKRVQNGTLEAPGSPLGAFLKKYPSRFKKKPPIWVPFSGSGCDLWGTYFRVFFGYPPGTTFGRFWSPTGLQKGGLWRFIW